MLHYRKGINLLSDVHLDEYHSQFTSKVTGIARILLSRTNTKSGELNLDFTFIFMFVWKTLHNTFYIKDVNS